MYREEGLGMHFVLLTCVYAMFFLSGAAALVYQVVWVRSLTLIFGGSHLAVTAVLSIFMAGLALGGYALGKYADRTAKPLRLYGVLELGIGLFALVFMALTHLYPSIYIPLAQGKDDLPLYLFFVRLVFTVTALIVPTTLMGGTLPVLSRFLSRQPRTLRSYLSFLYGFNTLGAVVGAAIAGFFLLRLFSVSTIIYMAVLTNLCIGVASILLQNKAETVLSSVAPGTERKERTPPVVTTPSSSSRTRGALLPLRLVLWGIGVSGFCALGYEVLWTRILTIVVGASVYGFTTMLVAFLTGIALGSEAYGLLPKLFKVKDRGAEGSVPLFGVVQIIIGLTALVVTIYIRDLPLNSIRLLNYFDAGQGFFSVKTWSNFALAFLYMVVPAFFMGVAFPLAGRVHAEYKRAVGGAVGEVLAYNTIGAILGAAVSGFFFIYLFGIERSLQMLIVINIAYGLLVLLSIRNSKAMNGMIAGMAMTALLFLAVNQNALKIWDMKYFAIFRNNQIEAFRTPEMVRDAVENTDVLYYAEGVESIVSSIKVKGGEQSFITNGRVEASSHLQGQQHLLTLGHLPMLLNKNPRKVLVVGTGSGMTLGATSVHPSVEQITLVELEPKVIGVARTFEEYNHHVLDNPKLKIVFNDGRNFLMTTKEKFDVITADPIHPWFRGAGYLYTTEYFKLASEHLRPGGIICQWLPIYELTTKDVKTVVKTFSENFKYMMLWLTHYDAEIIGSNSPILIDEAELERRIAPPAISGDLRRVMMGSATDFLSYFVLGTDGMRQFGQGGIINTDNNLYLEFSAPFSIGSFSVMEDNVNAIIHYRESILPYLVIPKDKTAREEQRKRWAANREAGKIAGPALALFLGEKAGTAEFQTLLGKLEERYPAYAPGRFLKNEYRGLVSLNPVLLQKIALRLTDERGSGVVLELSAVLAPVSKERAAVVFVDNNAKVIYGQRYFSGADVEKPMRRFATETLNAVQETYRQETAVAMSRGKEFPPAEGVLPKIREIITTRTAPNGPANSR